MTKKERKSIANRKYYEKNKDRLAEKWKNDDKRKEYLKEYYVKNREKIIERARVWNTKNRAQRKLIVERSKRTKLKTIWEVFDKN